MLVTIFTVLFVLICPLLVAIVLIQDPKGGGLAGVLGGAGGGSAFGAKTADVVTKATIGLGVVFFVLALLLGFSLKSETAIVPSIQENEATPIMPITPGGAAATTPTPGGTETPAAAPAGAATPEAPASGQGTTPAAPESQPAAPAEQPAQ